MARYNSEPRIYKSVSSLNCSSHSLSDSSHRRSASATASDMPLTLEKGDLPDKAFCLLSRRG
jgi:hypothetical protein